MLFDIIFFRYLKKLVFIGNIIRLYEFFLVLSRNIFVISLILRDVIIFKLLLSVVRTIFVFVRFKKLMIVIVFIFFELFVMGIRI